VIDEWDWSIDVDLKGVLYGITPALPYMQKQKSEHIINVSSVARKRILEASRDPTSPNRDHHKTIAHGHQSDSDCEVLSTSSK
jgi:NAD(P)-dependent dehydrogenase (short-subunit alcohol dehydrogenase family)